jgi:hypothetical protein
METVVGLVGATVVGAGGWWLGAHVGVMTAFMLNMVGTGIGLYAGRKVARHYLD